MRGCLLVVLLAALPVLADDGENAPPASEGVARLVDALRNSGSYKVRATAAVALGRLGDAEAVGPLAAAIRDDDNYAVRSAAASALGRLQVPEAVRPLLAALHDSDDFVRSEAKGSLQRFFSVPYLGVFREVLRSDDPVARRVAVQAFGEVAREPRGSPPEVAAAVVEALGDDDEGVAHAAEKALADLPHDRALPPLIGGLQGGSS